MLLLLLLLLLGGECQAVLSAAATDCSSAACKPVLSALCWPGAAANYLLVLLLRSASTTPARCAWQPCSWAVATSPIKLKQYRTLFKYKRVLSRAGNWCEKRRFF